MNDWGDFEDLVEFTKDLVEDQVREEQKASVHIFMEAVTQPAESRGQNGRTPVDSGKLMANTVVSLNNVDNKSYEIEDEDGYETYVKAMLMTSQATPYSKIYIQNNTREGKNIYALNADIYGWKDVNGNSTTPAYQFFTKSWMTLVNESGERNS
jgi:hypothetical protein